MKKLIATLLFAGACLAAGAQTGAMKEIKLNDPDKTRGKSVMQALAERKSTREFSTKELSLQDLSDLLWAAVGVNRPDGRRTAPSAKNMQDITVYACTKEGSYRYDAQQHRLEPVSEGDVRPLPEAPVCLIIVADDVKDYNLMDAGIVSQNISVFCAGVDLATVPRGTMDKGVLSKALKLTGTQAPILNHPVGYFK